MSLGDAYAMADARDQELQEQMHWEDVRLEAVIDEVLNDNTLLRVVLADWSEDSPALRRFAVALNTLYHDTSCMTQSVMQLRGALYALIHTRCRDEPL